MNSRACSHPSLKRRIISLESIRHQWEWHPCLDRQMFEMTELTPVFPSLEYTSYTYADQKVHKLNPETILDPTLASNFGYVLVLEKLLGFLRS